MAEMHAQRQAKQQPSSPVDLFAMRGRQKRRHFKITLGTRLAKQDKSETYSYVKIPDHGI